MRLLGWAVFALFAAVSLACIVPNYWLLWRNLRAKQGEKIPSLVPLMGGLIAILAGRVFMAMQYGPRESWSWWLLLLPLLDPGCYVLYFLVMVPVWKRRGWA